MSPASAGTLPISFSWLACLLLSSVASAAEPVLVFDAFASAGGAAAAGPYALVDHLAVSGDPRPLAPTVLMDGYIALLRNSPPMAQPLSLAVPFETATAGLPLFSDPDGDVVEVGIAKQPLRGQLVLDDVTSGAFTYTPDPGLVGDDSLVLQLCDGQDQSQLRVNVTVALPDERPAVRLVLPTDRGFEGYTVPASLALRAPAPFPFTVSLSTGGTAVLGQHVAMPTERSFALGQLSATLPIQVIEDDVVEPHRSLTLAIDPAETHLLDAPHTGHLTLYDNDWPPGQPLRLSTPGRAGGALLGETVEVLVWGGQPPYSVVEVDGAYRRSGVLNASMDVDGDGTPSPVERLLWMPLTTGSADLELVDDDGESVAISLAVTALPALTLDAPILPPSLGSQTQHRALGLGGAERLDFVLLAGALLADDRFQASAWDPLQGSWIQAPQQRHGRAAPIDGWYLASRDELAWPTEVTPTTLPLLIPLRPGWNFIALPLLFDGLLRGEVVALDDFELLDEFGQPMPAWRRADLIGGAGLYWTGSGYAPTGLLRVDRGVFVANTTSNPPQQLLLRLTALPDGVPVDDPGLPPPGPPPEPEGESGQRMSGSCGSGGGAGFALAVLMLFACWRRFGA